MDKKRNNPDLCRKSAIIIADSGATKCSWAIIIRKPESDETATDFFTTEGINAITTPEDKCEQILAEAFSRISPEFTDPTVTSVNFYGAGCVGKHKDILRTRIKSISGLNDIEVDSDMMGVSKALFDKGSGIACILGTGSNSCFYSNGNIHDNIPPLGWILGDEGSGAYIGARLVNAIYKRRIPYHLRKLFELYTSMSYDKVITRIYREASPNLWLGSLMPFIREHISYPEIERIVTDSFLAFIDNNLSAYDTDSLPIGFCGGIAYNFSKQLQDALKLRELNASSIIDRPIDLLVTQATETLLAIQK